MFSSVKSWLEGDPDVLTIFPTYAVLDPTETTLTMPVHAWVFEWETASWTRAGLVEGIRRLVDIDEDGPEMEFFSRRIAPFLVDNERGQKLKVRVADQDFEIGRTSANGHVFGLVEIPVEQVRDAIVERDGESFLRTEFRIKRDMRGREIPIVRPEGVSVISDIDDTIKITGVLDHKEMMRNTFLRPFRPVPDMAERFQEWAGNEGARFHYVSASPWQLLPFMQDFVERSGFPTGSIHMRTLRVKSFRSPYKFIKSSKGYKVETISSIMSAFPARKFILVGDSGERDPEVYGDIARQFPEQIENILIRLVDDAMNEKARFEKAFADLSNELWSVDRIG